MIRSVAVFLLALLCLPLACPADKAELQSLAPDNLIKGWKVVKGSDTYAKGHNLTEIYNGGYEVYIKAGVTEAYRRMYQKGDKYLEVTVHKMRSSKEAKALYNEKRRMEKVPPSQSRTFVSSGEGSTTAYGETGVWFVTVGMFDSSKESSKTALSTAEAVLKLAD